MKATRSSHRVLAGAALLGCLVGLAGCQGAAWTWPPASQPAPKPEPVKPSVLVDPCADQLHDICGQLLLYWSANRQLPESLAALIGEKPISLKCPVSAKPYAYNPEGLAMPGASRRVLVYDATPCHTSMRWSIVADPAGPGKPLVARVLLLPNNPAVFAPQGPPTSAPAKTGTEGKDERR